jgi:hypothetical protein
MSLGQPRFGLGVETLRVPDGDVLGGPPAGASVAPTANPFADAPNVASTPLAASTRTRSAPLLAETWRRLSKGSRLRWSNDWKPDKWNPTQNDTSKSDEVC